MESRTSPGKRGSVQPLSESRGDAARHCFLECTLAVRGGDDTRVG